jgi:hypothetical protein
MVFFNSVKEATRPAFSASANHKYAVDNMDCLDMVQTPEASETRMTSSPKHGLFLEIGNGVSGRDGAHFYASTFFLFHAAGHSSCGAGS